MDNGTSRRTVRRRGAGAAALAAAALGLLGACGDDQGGNGGSGAAAGRPPTESTNAVALQLIAFKPEMVTIDAGVTVTWTQKDPGVHTVTSGTVEQGSAGVTTAPDGLFDSGDLATGRTFAFRFDRPGNYPYFCSVHPATMRGEVRVR